MNTPQKIEFERHKSEINKLGFTTINNIYSKEEINRIVKEIENADRSSDTFRVSKDLFAIRQFLNELPETRNLIFNQKLNKIISKIFGDNYFVVKSIYFDKPESSNWYVAYHQDLTISVDKKISSKDFGPWTKKQNQFAVQPPIYILKNIYTIRIHLDHTNFENGALKVIPDSHSKGIIRPENIDWTTEIEKICEVEKGGIMIMKPLILHGSNRTTNNQKRRVIHIEFSDLNLPEGLKWPEKLNQKAFA